MKKERDYFAEVHAFIDDTETMKTMPVIAHGLNLDVTIVKSILKSGVCGLLQENAIQIVGKERDEDIHNS